MSLNNWIVATTTPNTTLGNMLVVSGAFLLLLVLIKHFAWGNISALLKKREETIANDLDQAVQAREQATTLVQEREVQLQQSQSEAAQIVAQAKEIGNNTREALMTETKAEVTKLKAQAKAEMASEREAVLRDTKDDVAALSLEIARKILQQEISADTHAALIDQYTESLGANDETR